MQSSELSPPQWHKKVAVILLEFSKKKTHSVSPESRQQNCCGRLHAAVSCYMSVLTGPGGRPQKDGPGPAARPVPGLLQQKHKVVRLLWVFAPSRIKTKNRILFSLNGLLNGAEQGSMCQTSRGREETPHEFLTNNNGRGSVGVVSPLYASVSLFIIKAAWRPAPWWRWVCGIKSKSSRDKLKSCFPLRPETAACERVGCFVT